MRATRRRTRATRRSTRRWRRRRRSARRTRTRSRWRRRWTREALVDADAAGSQGAVERVQHEAEKPSVWEARLDRKERQLERELRRARARRRSTAAAPPPLEDEAVAVGAASELAELNGGRARRRARSTRRSCSPVARRRDAERGRRRRRRRRRKRRRRRRSSSANAAKKKARKKAAAAARWWRPATLARGAVHRAGARPRDFGRRRGRLRRRRRRPLRRAPRRRRARRSRGRRRSWRRPRLGSRGALLCDVVVSRRRRRAEAEMPTPAARRLSRATQRRAQRSLDCAPRHLGRHAAAGRGPDVPPNSTPSRRRWSRSSAATCTRGWRRTGRGSSGASASGSRRRRPHGRVHLCAVDQPASRRRRRRARSRRAALLPLPDVSTTTPTRAPSRGWRADAIERVGGGDPPVCAAVSIPRRRSSPRSARAAAAPATLHERIEDRHRGGFRAERPRAEDAGGGRRAATFAPHINPASSARRSAVRGGGCGSLTASSASGGGAIGVAAADADEQAAAARPSASWSGRAPRRFACGGGRARERALRAALRAIAARRSPT